MDIDQPLLDRVIAIARQASDRILEVYDTDFTVEHKDDASPLTAADLASHEVIVAGLEAIDPQVPILSEESAQMPFAERSGWGRYWLVDPLDGTREFVKRNGEFTVNIALIEGHRPVLGVVHVPVKGESYSAALGLGAHKRSADGAAVAIKVRKRPAGTLSVAGSRSHGNRVTQTFIENLGDTELVAIGSSLKICLVAEGRADVYPRFGPTSEWDTAAAQCVVEQAGGLLTDTALQPLRYNTKESLLNPSFLVIGDPSEDWGRFIPEQPD